MPVYSIDDDSCYWVYGLEKYDAILPRSMVR